MIDSQGTRYFLYDGFMPVLELNASKDILSLQFLLQEPGYNPGLHRDLTFQNVATEGDATETLLCQVTDDRYEGII